MNRKDFFRSSLSAGACAGCFLLPLQPVVALASDSTDDEKYEQLLKEKEFIQNWLSDLVSTIETELDEPTRVKLLAGCGRGCFNRHQFKTDIAEKGKGDVDKLIEAYKTNFEAWKEGNKVHSRRGVTARQPETDLPSPMTFTASVPAPPIKPSLKPPWVDPSR